MNFVLLAKLVNIISQLLILLVFITSILSFFMSPYHPVREALDRLVNPMLAPIRRLIPTAGGLDFSPLILIILIQFIARVVVNILLSLN
ncbi:MAG: YggT family protein [Anaerolineales bacterium]|nr:YggT family protein [Anaerolineales bacterium]